MKHTERRQREREPQQTQTRVKLAPETRSKWPGGTLMVKQKSMVPSPIPLPLREVWEDDKESVTPCSSSPMSAFSEWTRFGEAFRRMVSSIRALACLFNKNEHIAQHETQKCLRLWLCACCTGTYSILASEAPVIWTILSLVPGLTMKERENKIKHL